MTTRGWLHIACLGLLLSSFQHTLTAQQFVNLDCPEALPGDLSQIQSFPDSAGINSIQQDILQKLYEAAYWEASVDSSFLKNDTLQLIIHRGPPYEWLFLKNGNLPDPFLQTTGFRPKTWINKPLQTESFFRLQKKLVTRAGDLGYPFARVFLDSISIENGQVAGSFFLTKGPFIRFEALEVEGSLQLSDRFLARYLGIREGEPYNESLVKKAKNRLAELPFVKIKKDPLVIFGGSSAKVGMHLDKKPASHFDFIIGVLPQNRETGKLLITGTFTGEMQNQFGLGERIFVNYEQLRPATRELNLAFNYPYVLDSPFGVDLSFGLYKRDSTYLDLQFNTGIQYLLDGGNYVKFFWQEFQSNLLAFDSIQIVSQKALPNPLDVKRQDLGIAINWNKTDYRFNPRKGFQVQAQITAGLKTIQRNNQILSLTDPQDASYDFNSLYDSLDLRSYQGRWEADIAWYIPVFQSHTIKLGVRSAGILSANPIYLNEQYRIGGNALLRGFDEEAIFSSNYAVSTFEYRILSGQNSYLFAFIDAAVTQDRTSENNNTDYPVGFGAGLTFETQAGIFGLSYALGRQQGNPIDFRAGKIHFGYVSLF